MIVGSGDDVGDRATCISDPSPRGVDFGVGAPQVTLDRHFVAVGNIADYVGVYVESLICVVHTDLNHSDKDVNAIVIAKIFNRIADLLAELNDLFFQFTYGGFAF
jgi:hypothetical protein